MKSIKYFAVIMVMAASLSSCVVRAHGPGWVPGHYDYYPNGGRAWVPGHYR
ncbi:hypothetical protein HDF24_22305 [Mucilaginibacter sp. X4EP1]|jgi:hypothetical protein|uniref:hypothetical protein n=1 Tax=Mucilaginibacter sp. X4EP1 TaxID=2723092 RepID=UPI00216A4F03|nr:hypothetical protein [Mucilaginibacter sp. X4EP1]MCS3812276.1 hypothetical protein [Mucilaginibacter sp. X4EP1]